MNILLCVSSSIAIYKACELARKLVNNGNNVRVVLSKSASEMISPIIFEALTGNEVYIGDTGKMEHISLPRWAHILVLCPATAHTIGAIANGIGGCLLLDIFLARQQTLRTFIVPAMNGEMWNNAFVQNNVEKLKNNGFTIINPQLGKLACGESGQGKLAEIDDIIACITPKNNIKVCITAGGTIEEMDSIRYITNHSSGKQALEIALEFARNGCDVTIIKAKTDVSFPHFIRVVEVKSANNMLEAVLNCVQNGCDIFISVAAVADFGFTKHIGKIKKENIQSLNLIKNPDILATVASFNNRPKCVIGFAAESENIHENARAKRQNKKCDFIVANHLVFGENNTNGVIIASNAEIEFSCTKAELAQSVYKISCEFISTLAHLESV